MQNIGLAREIAHEYVNRCPDSYEVLENYALMGLARAIERYDPSNGAKLSTFSRRYILGEIRHYLRDHIKSVKIPRAWQEWYEACHRYHSALEAAYNRGSRPFPPPPITEIDQMLRTAHHYGGTVGSAKPPLNVTWEEIEQAISRKIYSLDATLDERQSS